MVDKVAANIKGPIIYWHKRANGQTDKASNTPVAGPQPVATECIGGARSNFRGGSSIYVRLSDAFSEQKWCNTRHFSAAERA